MTGTHARDDDRGIELIHAFGWFRRLAKLIRQGEWWMGGGRGMRGMEVEDGRGWWMMMMEEEEDGGREKKRKKARSAEVVVWFGLSGLWWFGG